VGWLNVEYEDDGGELSVAWVTVKRGFALPALGAWRSTTVLQ
jgi:hypothetical protein